MLSREVDTAADFLLEQEQRVLENEKLRSRLAQAEQELAKMKTKN